MFTQLSVYNDNESDLHKVTNDQHGKREITLKTHTFIKAFTKLKDKIHFAKLKSGIDNTTDYPNILTLSSPEILKGFVL
jgi:hypothetical protein